jgi:hypothetical protein
MAGVGRSAAEEAPDERRATDVVNHATSKPPSGVSLLRRFGPGHPAG